MISAHVHQDTDAESITRVAAHLAWGGWPLADLTLGTVHPWDGSGLRAPVP